MKKNLKFEKIIFTVLISLTIIIFACGCTSVQGNNGSNFKVNLVGTSKNTDNIENNRVLNYDEVKDSLIRFHVIANSDNDDDQKLKLKVKDKVIDYLYPYLNKSASLDESRQIIKDRMQEVKKIAEEVIKENNYGYNVQVQLSRENFPEKSYGNITLPQGNYEAFRIIIGSGQGRNWWCVMFPPLCFVDESKAQVEYDKTEEKIKSSENQSNLHEQLNQDKDEPSKQEDDDKGNNNIQIKFKIVEMFKDLFS
ncbi:MULTISPECIES: stage II sporulation protein R [unclassified Clostridium]|uniref:stage II sporulation protein R n=1 Tax=unclassified Clostridium TaxID=2614128 RepID=UPI0002976F7E|nr:MULTISPECIES: stage II sporulation protein R [unclassified Clostridium]EKQ50851.1 MAG: stage II sporulation protein R [Clostridium sp. Maddingley MBC34-26]